MVMCTIKASRLQLLVVSGCREEVTVDVHRLVSHVGGSRVSAPVGLCEILPRFTDGLPMFQLLSTSSVCLTIGY